MKGAGVYEEDIYFTKTEHGSRNVHKLKRLIITREKIFPGYFYARIYADKDMEAALYSDKKNYDLIYNSLIHAGFEDSERCWTDRKKILIGDIDSQNFPMRQNLIKAGFRLGCTETVFLKNHLD